MFRVLALIEILYYVDCQSHIPHIKPQCIQVCTEMTFCGQFVSVHSPFTSDLRPWQIWAKKRYWRWPPAPIRWHCHLFCTVFFYINISCEWKANQINCIHQDAEIRAPFKPAKYISGCLLIFLLSKVNLNQAWLWKMSNAVGCWLLTKLIMLHQEYYLKSCLGFIWNIWTHIKWAALLANLKISPSKRVSCITHWLDDEAK